MGSTIYGNINDRDLINIAMFYEFAKQFQKSYFYKTKQNCKCGIVKLEKGDI